MGLGEEDLGGGRGSSPRAAKEKRKAERAHIRGTGTRAFRWRCRCGPPRGGQGGGGTSPGRPCGRRRDHRLTGQSPRGPRVRAAAESDGAERGGVERAEGGSRQTTGVGWGGGGDLCGKGGRGGTQSASRLASIFRWLAPSTQLWRGAQEWRRFSRRSVGGAGLGGCRCWGPKQSRTRGG